MTGKIDFKDAYERERYSREEAEKRLSETEKYWEKCNREASKRFSDASLELIGLKMSLKEIRKEIKEMKKEAEKRCKSQRGDAGNYNYWEGRLEAYSLILRLIRVNIGRNI